MPEQLAKDFVEAINYLLPGFLAAWVFFAFTSHPKPSNFERVVQAVVLTFIIQTVTDLVRLVSLELGNLVILGIWSKTSSTICSALIAFALGAALAHGTNSDKFHSWLRKRKLTSRTSHPSEWFYVFSKKVTFVVLQLNDGRRLYGWPKEWPIEPKRGQFYIMMAAWINDDSSLTELELLDGILIEAKDVKWVEFVKTGDMKNDE